MRRGFAALMLAAVAGTCLGCSDEFFFSPQFVVSGSVPFTAPDIYAQWWRDTEACSGRTADFGRIKWFVVPEASAFEFRGGSYSGYWWETHDVVLAGRMIDQASVVRHEMLHDLLGTGTHPPEYFGGRCAGLVEWTNS